ncbi:MAG: transcription elongation factor GreB [Proteobacteria bacterium]|nr:transcription elongation factor GreB [Pseudomonadota bacterium]
MSRYRPPRAKATPLITELGQRRLADELKLLWKVTRPEITRKVSEAAAQGDRSENAEYIYGKKALREIDARIQFLSKRLDELVVVDRLPPDRSRVYFGAWVTLEDDAGAQHRYRIVGADEFDRANDYISIDSPVAKALLKKTRGDEVDVKRPDGVAHYLIMEIAYDEPD